MIKEYIAKIEGHGTLSLNFNTSTAKLNIEQGERLIEGIMLDRPYLDAPFITSRICGVCPIAHHTASILALEDAFDIKPDRTSERLRKLMLCAQIIQSHTLHLYFLALSDYLKSDSTFSLAESKPRIFKNALILKKTSDHLADAVAGRNVHPITPTIGGFLAIPSKEKLQKALDECLDAQKTAAQTIELFTTFAYPKLQNQTKYLCLSSATKYPMISNTIEESSGEIFSKKNYTKNIIERVIKNSPAKFATYHGKTFMLGALARLSINASHLNPKTKKLYQKSLKTLGQFPTYNSFHNNFAQSIEIMHFLEEAIIILKKLIDDKNYRHIAPPKIKAKKAKGIGIVEAPRGILYHYYEITTTGKIKNCNIITPTAQSLANLESDAKELLLGTKDWTQKERTRLIKMLIRAYDPCITCSVH